jgi:hypothetical protein
VRNRKRFDAPGLSAPEPEEAISQPAGDPAEPDA